MPKSLLKLAWSINVLIIVLFHSAFPFTLQAHENYSQDVKKVFVSVDFNNATLTEVFNDLEKKTDFRFVYDKSDPFLNNRFSLKRNNVSVEAILVKISMELNLKFKQMNNNIAVTTAQAIERKVETIEVMMEEITVTGIVTSTDGGNEPLPGVTIMVKGTTIGTTSDVEGKYKLTVPDGNSGILIFSFIGYATQEVAIGSRSVIDVVLQPDVTTLQEIVVVGYGEVQRKDLTGSVASISESAIKKIPISSAAEAITGRLPGVQVVTTEGSPDAEIKIRVRGGGSITQDNSPLYIVDGFPVNSISNIPPTDIQSIDVLKDASSTAIYGARGANGVIIITTKSGKEGKVSVNFDAYSGIRKMANRIQVLNPYEYVMYQYEIDQGASFKNYYGAYEDLEIYKSVQGRDWVSEVFGRSALIQNYNFSVSGGSKMANYALSFTRTDEESIMIGSAFQRNNVNLKLGSELGKNVSVDFNNRLNYSVIDGAGVSSGSGANTRLRNSVKYAPTLGLREFSQDAIDDDDANSPETASLLYNPVESTADEYKKQFQFSNNTNAAINIKMWDVLKFRSEWGYQFTKNRTDNVWGPSTSDSKNNGGQPIGRVLYSDGTSWRNANTLTYDKKNLFDGHNVNFMLGQEIISFSTKSVSNESRFFPANMKINEVLSMMNLGTPQRTITRIGAENNLASFFGRVNYIIRDKYLFTLTYRADGSSKFAPGNQWGYFPSAAFAWRISEENFMQNISWLAGLKLRTSYGAAGNNRISDGLWKDTYTTSNDNNPYWPNEVEASQLVPGSTLDNPNLKWETTYTRNVGLDLQLFQARVSATVDVYHNTTKDLLIAAPLPAASGRSQQFQNIGQTSNRGIELSLEGILIDKSAFTLSTTFNIGFNRNKVDKFQNGDVNFKTYSSGWNGSAQPLDDYLVQEGQPVGLMFGYVTDGMYSFDDFTFNTTNRVWEINPDVPSTQPITSSLLGPGSLKFKDVDGDGFITAKDKTVIGNANPKHTGGFGVNMTYKSFDLSVFLNWSYGNDIYNANKLDYTAQLLSRKYQNLIDDMSLAHRFTIIDPVTGYNIYSGINANPERLAELNQNASIWSPIMTLTPLHSWAIEDGSFIRINNVSVGYSLPKSFTDKLRISRLRIYATGYNLYTFTNYSGFDPEVDTRRGTPLTPGVDYSAYPRSRTFVGGINLTF